MSSTILLLPKEIMEDIFLRLDDAADVARASAACRFHRSVVRDHGFLRRYRFRHPPPVLGFPASMGNGGFFHAEAPHKSAPAASSLAEAADFTFSFLPMDSGGNHGSRIWRVCDARDGRVLLSRRSADPFLELVICDPLYCRYELIPAIPQDLWDKRYSTEMKSEPFLLQAQEEEEESQFRVIYNWMSRYKIITFLFSSDNRRWSVATSFSFLPDRLIHDPMDFRRHYVGSCFYWVHPHVSNYMLVLDPLDMQFSITRLSDVTGGDILLGLAVVDAGVNRLGIIVLHYDGYLDLHSKACQNNGGSTEEWQLDKHHSSEGYKRCEIIGAAEGCLVLKDYSMKMVQYFIMDQKTFLVERFCKRGKLPCADYALPYARYPPSLSPPSI